MRLAAALALALALLPAASVAAPAPEAAAAPEAEALLIDPRELQPRLEELAGALRSAEKSAGRPGARLAQELEGAAGAAWGAVEAAARPLLDPASWPAWMRLGARRAPAPGQRRRLRQQEPATAAAAAAAPWAGLLSRAAAAFPGLAALPALDYGSRAGEPDLAALRARAERAIQAVKLLAPAGGAGADAVGTVSALLAARGSAPSLAASPQAAAYVQGLAGRFEALRARAAALRASASARRRLAAAGDRAFANEALAGGAPVDSEAVAAAVGDMLSFISDMVRLAGAAGAAGAEVVVVLGPLPAAAGFDFDYYSGEGDYGGGDYAEPAAEADAADGARWLQRRRLRSAEAAQEGAAAPVEPAEPASSHDEALLALVLELAEKGVPAGGAGGEAAAVAAMGEAGWFAAARPAGGLTAAHFATIAIVAAAAAATVSTLLLARSVEARRGAAPAATPAAPERQRARLMRSGKEGDASATLVVHGRSTRKTSGLPA
jgi:hypothetical protein